MEPGRFRHLLHEGLDSLRHVSCMYVQVPWRRGGGGVDTLFISVYLAAGMAVEAVPVMALKGQHVLCGQAVGILLHPRFIT
jgi:hypothetical protein